jgi:hypothetical protein
MMKFKDLVSGLTFTIRQEYSAEPMDPEVQEWMRNSAHVCYAYLKDMEIPRVEELLIYGKDAGKIIVPGGE